MIWRHHKNRQYAVPAPGGNERDPSRPEMGPAGGDAATKAAVAPDPHHEVVELRRKARTDPALKRALDSVEHLPTPVSYKHAIDEGTKDAFRDIWESAKKHPVATPVGLASTAALAVLFQELHLPHAVGHALFIGASAAGTLASVSEELKKAKDVDGLSRVRRIATAFQLAGICATTSALGLVVSDASGDAHDPDATSYVLTGLSAPLMSGDAVLMPLNAWERRKERKRAERQAIEVVNTLDVGDGQH